MPDSRARRGRSYRNFWLALGAGTIAFVLLVTLFLARPWWFSDPGADAYASSLRRKMNYNGGGHCEPYPGVEGVFNCAIAEPGSDYSQFVLKKTGKEGCWSARFVNPSYNRKKPSRLGEKAASGCAGIIDTTGFFNDDFRLEPVPNGLARTPRFKDWIEGG